jgi:hypothetical protein
MKYRIQENIYGNWNGYEGTRKTKQFGSGLPRQAISPRMALHPKADR